MAALASQLKAGNTEKQPEAETVKEDVKAPSWRDLISSYGETNVTRMQILFFTVLTALLAAMHVIDGFQIPRSQPVSCG